jgi:hypothetical protein
LSTNGSLKCIGMIRPVCRQGTPRLNSTRDSGSENPSESSNIDGISPF